MAERGAEGVRSRRGGSWEDAGGLGSASSSDDVGMLGEGSLKRAAGGGDASASGVDSDGTGASGGGSGCGGTGSSTKPILHVDFFLS